ncbi:hypothetical protein COOONC_21385 [Cooperia oncophora]
MKDSRLIKKWMGRDFLPKEYAKSKENEKKIVSRSHNLKRNEAPFGFKLVPPRSLALEHGGISSVGKNNYKQLSGTSDLDAKSKYVHLCRGLKTYGVTFFLVKGVMADVRV